jgi:hypothetical protein
MKASDREEEARKAEAARRNEAVRDEPRNTLEDAKAQAELAKQAAENNAGDRKLSEAELAAIEEDALRRRFATPQKEATSVPLEVLYSANQPKPPTFDEVLAELNFPASKADIVTMARNRGMMIEERYMLERMEDRLYVDMEQVKAAMRAAPL